jgi:hypothetical protein
MSEIPARSNITRGKVTVKNWPLADASGAKSLAYRFKAAGTRAVAIGKKRRLFIVSAAGCYP